MYRRLPISIIKTLWISPIINNATRYNLKTINNPYNNKIAKYQPKRNINTKKRVRTRKTTNRTTNK